ncbi:unnamed protein product [Mytilus coruscus]|uniref:VWFD domain-containing protein n=1 Tax=Mytilus coruscus TaxID=42192 RepID=A0A6J8E7C8_MYTCO|nr:unnamed protein product [Mytilus coruscus]
MPSETWIEIRLSSSFPTILTAFINPSMDDWMNSRGLCGFVSHNCPDDFIKPDGNKAAIPGVDLMCSAPRIEGAETFIRSWQVNADDNLFTLEPNAALSPSITTLAYCTCPNRVMDDMDASFGCGGATIDCSLDFELDNVGAEKCNILLNSRQRKRSLKYSMNTAQNILDLKEEKLPRKVCCCY